MVSTFGHSLRPRSEALELIAQNLKTRLRRLSIVDAVIVLLALAVYYAHAARFGSWIVDDAAISFSYSRSLGTGAGLVSQPGAIPAEGFSNPLWVFLLSPFFTVRLFDPVWTPKVISGVLVAVAYIILFATLRKYSNIGRTPIGLGLLLTSLNTSFVVWTISGLENALYVALIVVSLRGLYVSFTPRSAHSTYTSLSLEDC